MAHPREQYHHTNGHYITQKEILPVTVSIAKGTVPSPGHGDGQAVGDVYIMVMDKGHMEMENVIVVVPVLRNNW